MSELPTIPADPRMGKIDRAGYDRMYRRSV